MSYPARQTAKIYLKSENSFRITFTASGGGALSMIWDEYKIALKSSYNDNIVDELTFVRTDNVFTFTPTSAELDNFTQNTVLEFQFITTGQVPYVPLVIDCDVINAFSGQGTTLDTSIVTDDVTVQVETQVGEKGDAGEPLDPTAYDTKASIADADTFTAFDSEATDNPVKIAWSVFKSTLNSVYQAILAEGAFVDGDKTKLDNVPADTNDALSGKANLTGGNTFTGDQVINDGSILHILPETDVDFNAIRLGRLDAVGTTSRIVSNYSIGIDIDNSNAFNGSVFKVTKHNGAIELLAIDEDGELRGSGIFFNNLVTFQPNEEKIGSFITGNIDIQGRGNVNLYIDSNNGGGTAYFNIYAKGNTNKVFVVQDNGNTSVKHDSPDTALDVNGAITQRPLSADPADPDVGNSVQWVSSGVGSGDAGDVMMKINVGGTVKTITLIDYSAS